jgi:hypothetical protein
MAMRQCGSCNLCCKLLPVPPLGKKAGERCKHQRHRTGCVVYHKPGMPPECALWNCRWLVANDTADLRRPDHAHYVIDVMPDHITLQDNQTGATMAIEVVQIWIDPAHPHAHRDPALRRYLLRRGEEGIAALVRYDSRRAVVIIPPNMIGEGDAPEGWMQPDGWVEVPYDSPNAKVEKQHSIFRNSEGALQVSSSP